MAPDGGTLSAASQPVAPHRAGLLGPPAPNTVSRPYRGLSVQETDVPLTTEALTAHLTGREVYRRTDYLVLRNGDDLALVQVRREPSIGLFETVAEAAVLAGPGETVWIDAPGTDVGNATALAQVAAAHRAAGIRAYVVRGLFEHVNFIWDPQPLRIRVGEVVPPEPPKLYAMARQALAFDEELPPIDLQLEAIDIEREVARHPAPAYLLPCRGSGIDLDVPVAFLDTRPARQSDWLLVGCERSAQFHRHFYGDAPPRADICPRRRAPQDGELRLTKCCLLERGIEHRDKTVVVPWGANLGEVLGALRLLAGLTDGAPAPNTEGR